MLPQAKTTPPPPAPSFPARTAAPTPPAVASGLFILYLFLLISRATEFTIQIPKLLLVLGFVSALAASVTSFSLVRLTGRSGLLLLAFTAILFVSTPFSYWRGGSAAIIYGWLANVVVFLAGAQLLTTPRLLRRALATIAAATLFLSVFAGRFLSQAEGRLDTFGTMGNSNDLAAVLLFGIPCWFLLFNSAQQKPLRRLLFLAVMGIQLLLILWTGSRGGLLSLFLLVLIALMRLPTAKKLVLMVAIVLFALATLPFLPDSVLERYRSWSTESSVDEVATPTEAVASARLRRLLMAEAVRVTFKHPLLGVGPGQFILAANEEFEKRGDRALWLAAHNSYLQVSSELGIPALLIYIGLLFHAARLSYRVARRGEEQLRPLGWCIFLMTVSYCATSFFLNLPYQAYVPTLAAVTASLERFPFPSGSAAPVRLRSPVQPSLGV